MDDNALVALLERHRAFWQGQAGLLLEEVGDFRFVDSSVSSRGLPLADGTRSVQGQEITPELIDPQRFYDKAKVPGTPIHGDFLTGMGPPHLCWTEASIGCPVRMMTGGPWAEPFGADWRALHQLTPDERWLDKLEQFVRLLAPRCEGRCGLIQPLMRGPADMMASAIGHEAACMALVQEPEAAEAFLAWCAEVFLQLTGRQQAHTPSFAEGYLSSYGIWAPGTVVRTQIDNATMLSPGLYRERVLEYDRRIIESFDFPLIHLHSGCLHVVEPLLDMAALSAVQVSIDHPGGPLATDVMPVLERIVKRKPLIVTGPVTAAELERLRSLVDLGSLCLRVRLLPEEHG